MQSQTERDHEGLKAKLERESESHTVVPSAIDTEELTGRYEGEELIARRAQRPTDKRIERLEIKHDELASDLGEVKEELGGVRETVAGIRGEMKVWPQLVTKLEQAVDRSLQTRHEKFTATLEVDKAAATAGIEVEQKRQTAEIETDKAARIAKIEIYKTVALRIIAGLAAAAAFLGLGAKLATCVG